MTMDQLVAWLSMSKDLYGNRRINVRTADGEEMDATEIIVTDESTGQERTMVCCVGKGGSP